ncbi:MAG: transporter associated domain-containing protein [Gammaproteobacteria bacterium]
MSDSIHKSWLERLGSAFSRPKTREALFDWLEDASQDHLIEPEALTMIAGVLQVYDMQVRDVMVPRSQMVVLKLHSTLEQILPIVISSAHSRFPVINQNPDEVVGILLAKDLLPYTFNREAEFNLEQLLRPAVFIPENKKLDTLLEEFRLTRNHIALVVDEYGGVSGMLSIEDVLEEIVGEIQDEYDIDEPQTNITQINETQYTVKGLTPIEQFNEFFKTQLSAEDADTMGKFITEQFGYLPKRDETLTIQDIEFKILYANKRKIGLLQIELPFNASY